MWDKMVDVTFFFSCWFGGDSWGIIGTWHVKFDTKVIHKFTSYEILSEVLYVFQLQTH
jgi:hypothetical protein